MTYEGDDPGKVAGEPVRRRYTGYPVVASAIAILVLAAIAVTGLLGTGRERPDSSLEPSGSGLLELPSSSAEAAPSESNAPSRSLQPRSANPARPTSGSSPALANAELSGSPEIVLFQRLGDDITVLGWRPGETGLTMRQTLPGAAREIDDSQSLGLQLSADGTLLLLHAGPVTLDAQDTFRVFRLEGSGGSEIWHSSALGSGIGAAFDATGMLIIRPTSLLLRDRAWTVVDFSRDEAVVHDVDVPPFPERAPTASVDFRTAIVNYIPLAASADRRWLYVVSAHVTEPIYRPAYRVSIATGRSERIRAFPTAGEARIVSHMVDPGSGRLLLAGPFKTGGEGFIQAWSPGAASADFAVDLGTTLFDAVWTDDGGVIAADYDRLPGPFRFRILSLEATGKINATLLEAHGTNAAFLGVRDGFAGAYIASRDSTERELVVIRLSDGATAGVQVSEPEGLYRVAGIRR